VGVLLVGPPTDDTAASSPSPTTTATPRPSPSPSRTPEPLPSLEPSPEPDVLVGEDGRFTILLLGSDYRPSHPGNRTDVVMVVSIDPTSGQTAVVSIPRDTVRFPLPDGGVYGPKVNGLYQSLIAREGRAEAGAEMKRIVGSALGVEVDWYAVVGFEGVRQLVDAVGGVDVTLARAVDDPYYWVTSKQRGVYFPAGKNHLDGERALIFARTRKGDNDYERARRQQLLVAAAVAKVKAQGVAIVPELLRIGSQWVRTDLPLDKLIGIYEIADKADLATEQRTVFGPRRWADGVPGTASIVLKMGDIRKVIDDWMPPVPSPAPPPSPLPSPSG